MRGNKAKAARATKTLHNLRKKNKNHFQKGIDSIKAMPFMKRIKFLFFLEFVYICPNGGVRN